MMKFNNKDINKMYIGDTLVNRVNDGDFQYMPKHDYASDYLTFDIVSGGTINWLVVGGDIAVAKTISYSTDNGQTWTEITSSTGGTSFNVSAGDKVLFKGENNAYASGTARYSTFNGSTATFNVEGNIMSLIYGDDFAGHTTLSEPNCFPTFFKSTNVVDASRLILSGMGQNCYQGMFNACYNLTSAPELPATTLASGCYSSMFNACTSLTTAPELPATTLVSSCYDQMFRGCTSLTEAPSLPATTLAERCYYRMFFNCTSLSTAPELPATTLAQSCYNRLFFGCTSLSYIKCLATDISANNCTWNWLNGVAATGTFVKAASMNDWTTGTSGIPEGWTIENV